MNIRFSKHAKQRLKERHVAEAVVREAIESPDKIERSNRHSATYLVKKLVKRDATRLHVLIVIYQVRGDDYFILTVIDTSKIKKYY